jgi:hypothetical protein
MWAQRVAQRPVPYIAALMVVAVLAVVLIWLMGSGGPSVVNVGPVRNLAPPHTGTLLSIRTGYPGGDVVEPSVLYDKSAPFLGYEYVLSAAAYHHSNADVENPTLWVSHDGVTWIPLVHGVPTPRYPPLGVISPVVQKRVPRGDGNLSDPFLTRGPDGTYYILFNQFLNPGNEGGSGGGPHDLNWSIKGISARSLAGPWSKPVTVFASNLSVSRPSSPSAFWDGVKWQVYDVDLTNLKSTFIGHYTVSGLDLLHGAWVSQPRPDIAVPRAYSTQVWWHLNAYRWGTEEMLIVQDNSAGSSGGGNLWSVVSPDGGATWVVPSRPLMSGVDLYRSAIVPSRSGPVRGFDVFYGVNGNGGTTWRLGRTFARSVTVG